MKHYRPKKPKRPKRVSNPDLVRKRFGLVRNVNTVEQVGLVSSCESTFSSFTTTNGPNSGIHHSPATTTHVGTKSRTGVGNPHFKDQIRHGTNATTQFVGTDVTVENSYWSGYSIGRGISASGALVQTWDYVGSGWLTPPIPVAPAAPSNIVTVVHNRCIAKFIDEVTAAQSSENLTGRSIRHFKHDVHSTLHPMAAIQTKTQEYLAKLKKAPYRHLKAQSLLNVITQSYLEYKFGVAPFVQDISDIVADMVIRDRKRNASEPIQARAHQAYSGSVVSRNATDVGFMSIFGLQQQVHTTSTYYEQMRGAVRTGINDDGRLGVLQDNRLLPDQWAPTLFSIMPYAWMVNYFTNIREIIDAAALRYSDLVWGCQSTRDETVISVSDLIATNPKQQHVFANVSYNDALQLEGGHALLKWKTFKRFVISPAGLMPSFVFSIPTTATPWVNMMAAFGPQVLSITSKIANAYKLRYLETD
jgi:hypothetical protein